MPTTEPALTLEQLRVRVEDAFCELPANAFEQVLTWVCPDNGRTYRFDALNGLQLSAFRQAVNDYFDAKRGEQRGR